MSPRKEAPPPNLLKPYPATLNGPLCARCSGGSLDALCGPCARAEVRSLRRDRARRRKALREAIEQMDQRAHYTMRDVIQRMNDALKPKARRRKA